MISEKILEYLNTIDTLILDKHNISEVIKALIAVKNDTITLNNAKITRRVVSGFELVKMNSNFRRTNPELKASFLTHLGELYRSLTDWEKTRRCYSSAIRIFEREGRIFEKAQVMANIISLAYDTQDSKSIFSLLEELKTEANELKSPQKELILAQYNMQRGAVFQKQMNHQDALNSYLSCEKLRTELKTSLTKTNERKSNLQALYHCKMQLGTLALEQNRLILAISYYRQVLPYYQKIYDKRRIRIILRGLSKIYWHYRRFENAIEVQEELVKEYLKDDDITNAIDCKNALMSLQLSNKNPQQAKKIMKEIQKELQFFKGRRIEIEFYNNCGWLYQQEEKYERAIEMFEKALQLAKKRNDSVLELKTLRNFFSTYYFQQKYQKAIQYAEITLTYSQIQLGYISSQELRIAIRKEDIIMYKRLCKIHILRNDFPTALRYLDRSKGIELRMAQQKKKRPSGSLNQNLSYESEMNQIISQIYSLRENIKENKDEKEYQKELAKLRQNYFHFQERSWVTHEIVDTATAAEIIQWEGNEISKPSFPSEKWYIIYFFYELETETLWIFGIHQSRDNPKKQEINLFNIALSKSEYKQLTKRNRQIIRLSNQKDDLKLEKTLKELSKDMYRLLIPKLLKKDLDEENPEFLILIPIESLHELPYEILYDNEEYWGLKYSISRSISLAILHDSVKQTTAQSGLEVLLLAPETAELETSEEISSLQTIIRSSQGQIKSIIPKKITRDRFLEEINSESYSVVHFAGHGDYLIELPEGSCLHLEDGIISANEIGRYLNYNPHRLVVLNACETGIAHFELGDEPQGMIRGFIEAGTSSLLLTGWSIIDDSAIDFVRHFYSQLSNGRFVAEAAQEARLAIHKACLQYRIPNELVRWGAYRVLNNPFYSIPICLYPDLS